MTPCHDPEDNPENRDRLERLKLNLGPHDLAALQRLQDENRELSFKVHELQEEVDDLEAAFFDQEQEGAEAHEQVRDELRVASRSLWALRLSVARVAQVARVSTRTLPVEGKTFEQLRKLCQDSPMGWHTLTALVMQRLEEYGIADNLDQERPRSS